MIRVQYVWTSSMWNKYVPFIRYKTRTGSFNEYTWIAPVVFLSVDITAVQTCESTYICSFKSDAKYMFLPIHWVFSILTPPHLSRWPSYFMNKRTHNPLRKPQVKPCQRTVNFTVDVLYHLAFPPDVWCMISEVTGTSMWSLLPYKVCGPLAGEEPHLPSV